MPFDFVKTQCQKDQNSEKSLIKIMKYNIEKYGFKSLYIGWQFRYLQFIIQSLLTVKTLDYLENKAKLLK